MKTKNFISFVFSLLLFLICGLFCINSAISQQNPRKMFRIGSSQCGVVNSNYNLITELGINMWHFYSGSTTEPYRGWNCYGAQGDKRETSGPGYTNAVNGKILQNFQSPNYLITDLDRIKINYLGWGKRSDYQCESDDHINADYIEFSFQNHVSCVSQDYIDVTEQTWGRSSFVNNSNGSCGANFPGYIVSNVRANKDQWNNDSGATDEYWYLLPRMKIDEDYFYNNINSTDPVCKIEIELKKNGQVIKALNPIIFYPIHFSRTTSEPYTYDGKYVESFPILWNNGTSVLKIPANEFQIPNSTNPRDEFTIDYKITWCGNCNFYIDRLRVENQIAYNLFGDNPNKSRHNTFHDEWLPYEVKNIAIHGNGDANYDNIHNFYYDEFMTCQIPVLKYINHKIDSIAQREGKTDLGLVPILYMGGINPYPPRHPGARWDLDSFEIKRIYLDNMGLKELQFDIYPIQGGAGFIPQPQIPDNIKSLPQGYSYDPSKGQLAYLAPPDVYDNNLQLTLDQITYGDFSSNGFIGTFKLYSGALREFKRANPEKDIPMIAILQAHLNWNNDGYLKEPTNEEIRVMSYIALSYGAKSISYFGHMQYGAIPGDKYCRGFLNWESNTNDSCANPNVTKRFTNAYGQNKWDTMAQLIPKIKHLGELMLDFDIRNTYSYVYKTENVQAKTFFDDIYTYKPDNANVNNPSPNPELPQNRYLQIGVFKKDLTSFDKYFMVINRRCTPFYSKDDDFGGGRYISVQFKSNTPDFEGFNNWKVINMDDNSLVATFDKQNPDKINLDWFLPGEGKLYKIAPVMQEGGEFVCDESFGNLTVNCKGNVNTNGHSLQIFGNTTIEFNADCGITGQDCSEIDVTSYSQPINFKGKNGARWSGITLNNVYDGVYFVTAYFSDLKDGWAINMSDCPNVMMLGDVFNFQNISDPIGGAIFIDNRSYSTQISWVHNCNIYLNNASMAVTVLNNAAGSGVGDFVGNTILSNGNSSVGILLTNCCYNSCSFYNIIEGFNENMHVYCTDISLKQNTLFTSRNNSKGIIGSAGSNLQMQRDFPSFYGTSITNLGNDCINLEVDNSTFNSFRGYNTFVVNPNTNSYNIYGILDPVGPTSLNAENCCFNNNPNNNSAIHHINDIYGLTRRFSSNNSICSTIPGGDNVDAIVENDFGVNDTLFTTMDTSSIPPTYSKSLYGYFYRNVFKRNYDSVIVQGTELLSNFTNEINPCVIIPKLYISYSKVDTTYTRMQGYKNYLEQLILNHSDNTQLVLIANYFVQKCKVYLEQYQSALAGFEDIITQNPYDQLGVLASWDYAATYMLLDTMPGSGGFNDISESSYNYEYLIDSLRIKKLQKYDDYDNSVFTPSQRNDLFKKTGNILKDERTKQVMKVEYLENELKKSKSDTKKLQQVKKELSDMKVINEVAKIKKPKTQIDYVNIINKDINKLVKKGNGDNVKEIIGVPLEYKLSQNYPNPFNPNTKINYELPKDGKVKIVIYDILGREMKSLVNNEFKTAGRYTVEFNGSQFASGVYFYRIQVEGGKEFTAVKKMVLVK